MLAVQNKNEITVIKIMCFESGIKFHKELIETVAKRGQSKKAKTFLGLKRFVL